jgi:DNA-directed RNA polymerase specialized sigma24 family protein
MKKVKKNYVLNKELIQELKHYTESGEVTEELHLMLYAISTNIAKKANWNQYTFIKDMIHSAYIKCLDKLHKYDPKKTSNPFSYFTTIVHNFFIDFIQSEGKQQKIKLKNQQIHNDNFYNEFKINIKLPEDYKNKIDGK